jgi:hypothetical protein
MKYVLLQGVRRGCDRMVVGFTITYAINAYHHESCDLNHAHGGVYLIQYVIKFCQ